MICLGVNFFFFCTYLFYLVLSELSGSVIWCLSLILEKFKQFSLHIFLLLLFLTSPSGIPICYFPQFLDMQFWDFFFFFFFLTFFFHFALSVWEVSICSISFWFILEFPSLLTLPSSLACCPCFPLDPLRINYSYFKFLVWVSVCSIFFLVMSSGVMTSMIFPCGLWNWKSPPAGFRCSLISWLR